MGYAPFRTGDSVLDALAVEICGVPLVLLAPIK